MSFKIGDKVLFGRKHGQQSLGEVVKVNRKSLKVKLLEPRGVYKAHAVGGIWRCAPSLCTLVADHSQSQFPVIEKRSEEELMRSIDILYSRMSPENISWDGERSRTEVKRAYSRLKAQLRVCFKELGREVSEHEAYTYCKNMR